MKAAKNLWEIQGVPHISFYITCYFVVKSLLERNGLFKHSLRRFPGTLVGLHTLLGITEERMQLPRNFWAMSRTWKLYFLENRICATSWFVF